MSKAADSPFHLRGSPEARLVALPAALPAQGFTLRGNNGLQGTVPPVKREASHSVPTTQEGPVPQGNEAFAEHMTSYLAKKAHSSVLAPMSDL